MKNPIVAMDVDEVCADLLSRWLALYNRDYGDELLPEDISEWDLTKFVKKECGKDIYKYLHRPNLYDHVQPMGGARSAIRNMRDMGARIVFVSSCVGGTAQAKIDWLARWGFAPKAELESGEAFIATRDKNLVRADILFDDYFHNVQRFPGVSFMVRRTHNRNIYWPRRAHVATMDLALAPLVTQGD